MARNAEKSEHPLSYSLLWPAGSANDATRLNSGTVDDLGLAVISQHLVVDSRRTALLRDIVSLICRDKATINYRLDIIDDLLLEDTLLRCFEELSPVIGELRFFVERPGRDDVTPLEEVVWRLRELEFYVESITRLGQAFEDVDPRSAGLIALRSKVAAVMSDPTYRKLLVELPDLVERVANLKSITIGINLDEALLPHEATLISINREAFKGSPAHRKIVSGKEGQGIAPLHSGRSAGFFGNPTLIPLFRDLSNVMDRAIRPLGRALKEFVSVNSRLIIKLQDELLFYTGAVRMIRKLRDAGLPVSRPRIRERESRTFVATELYNINLALHLMATGIPDEQIKDHLVTNEFSQDDTGRIAILTGPNRGGKTTFLQAVGLTQILAQLGLFVPSSSAEISLVDNILTHYPAKEDLEKGTGRLGDEAERLRGIFAGASRFSLVLFNETLSSTSHSEAIYLAQDLLRVLRMMGARAIYTTHFHALAADFDAIHRDTPGDSTLVSLVAEVTTHESADGTSIRPTFRIVQGPPSGRSYALELAQRYGISKEQLVESLSDRFDFATDGGEHEGAS